MSPPNPVSPCPCLRPAFSPSFSTAVSRTTSTRYCWLSKSGSRPLVDPILDLEHPELQLRRLGHLLRSPDRLPDDGDLHRADARKLAHFAFDFRRERSGCGTGGRGQGHVDGDGSVRADVGLVDGTELVDVDGDLRVVARFQNVEDLLLETRLLLFFHPVTPSRPLLPAAPAPP